MASPRPPEAPPRNVEEAPPRNAPRFFIVSFIVFSSCFQGRLSKDAFPSFRRDCTQVHLARVDPAPVRVMGGAPVFWFRRESFPQ